MTARYPASRILTLAVFTVLALLLASSTARAESVCTISSFFSFDSNDQVTDTLQLEGRGLATCRNEIGTVTETPVIATVEANVIGPMANSGELTFSANSKPFTVAGDLAGQVQGPNPKMQMKYSTQTKTFEKIAVKAITFRFDDSAPTLE